jgi:hypothetical protein
MKLAAGSYWSMCTPMIIANSQVCDWPKVSLQKSLEKSANHLSKPPQISFGL